MFGFDCLDVLVVGLVVGLGFVCCLFWFVVVLLVLLVMNYVLWFCMFVDWFLIWFYLLGLIWVFLIPDYFGCELTLSVVVVVVLLIVYKLTLWFVLVNELLDFD